MKVSTLLLISVSAIGLFVTGCMHVPTDDNNKERDSYSTRLAGLRWLKSIQNADGSWGEDSGSQPALTSLSILAFLNSGHTPTSDEFGLCVENGMLKLLSYAESGLPADRMENEYISTDSIFAWVLSESYGMTRVPDFVPAANNALKRVVDSGNKVSPWTVQAINGAHSSGLPRGLNEEEYREAIKKAICEPVDGDMFSYAKSLHDRSLAGGSVAEYDQADRLTKILAESVSTSGKAYQQDCPMLMFFLCSKVFWHYGGGEIWDSWNKEHFDEVLKNQVIDGRLGWWGITKVSGSKEKGLWQGSDAIVYATALIILSYPPDRCLPTFKNYLIEPPDIRSPADDDIKIDIQI
jgi:hypothetical protein